MFSSLESQGLRNGIPLGHLEHPSRRHQLGPARQRLRLQRRRASTSRRSCPTAASSSRITTTSNTLGFGTYFKLPAEAPAGTPPFCSAGGARAIRACTWAAAVGITGPGPLNPPFRPYGMESLTRFATGADDASALSDRTNKSSPRVGKVTHPCGAPDNHLLTVWSPGPGPVGQASRRPIDSGIYLIKDGKPIDEPGADAAHQERSEVQRAMAAAAGPLQAHLRRRRTGAPAAAAQRRQASPHLPEGTPFGLVGTSSLYKREIVPARRGRQGRA